MSDIASSLREAHFQVTEIYFKDWVNNFFSPKSSFNLIALLKERQIDIRILGACLCLSPHGKVPHRAGPTFRLAHFMGRDASNLAPSEY